MIEHLDEPLEVWRGLLYGQRAMMTRLMAQVKREFGLTVPQYEALLFLSESPERRLAATDLAAGLLYSSGSASHLISRLAELGLVERTSDPADSRKVIVGLTLAGADVIDRATDAHVEALNSEFATLISPEALPVLLEFARTLAAHEGVNSQIFK